MRAWNAGGAAAAATAEPTEKREEDAAAAGKKRERESEKPGKWASGQEPEPKAKEAKTGDKASAQDLDSELRAFMDGKAAARGTGGKKFERNEAREKKFGKAAPSPVVAHTPESLAAAIVDVDNKIARAKRFGTVNPDLEKQKEALEAKVEQVKADNASAEEKAKVAAAAAEEKAKLAAEAAEKKALRAKRFGIVEKPAEEKAAAEKPAEEKAATTSNGNGADAQKKADRAKRFATPAAKAAEEKPAEEKK